MHEKSDLGGLDTEIGHRGTAIVLSVSVDLVGVKGASVTISDQTDDGSVLGPALIEIYHEGEHFGVTSGVGVHVSRDNVPRLLVVRRGSPASGFNASGKFFGFNANF